MNEINQGDTVVTVHMSPVVTSEFDGHCPLLTPVREATGLRQSCLHKKLAMRRPKDQLMCRANSLKKAFRQIIEHAEKGKDQLMCWANSLNRAF